MRSRLTAALLLLLPIFFLAYATPTAAHAAAHRAGSAYTALQWTELAGPVVGQQHRTSRLQARSGPFAGSGGIAVLPEAVPYRRLLITGEGGPAGLGLPVPLSTSIAPARAPPSTAQ
ncbi:hypothetical protein [Microtetraspora sp. NBRC 16547]|uniref:hypothetical protein n=1 Tax=Microtetraspora sp. NBRC 16547 TaxID=3030993 RepID=UPI0024A3E6D6|nr:hypothetical protein [Microtetraspora sp. NBRC 16547]GLW99009.1 hypothetical protein Misp02_30960 [Microtetraspora sp. NBRC 16547]